MYPSARIFAAATLLFAWAGEPASAQVSFGIGTTSHLAAEAKILQQLESRDAFVFEDVALNDFVQSLRDRFGINMRLDKRSLDDFGIDTSTPISVRLVDVTLESGLNVVLNDLDLTWMIRHEALIITTPEQAEARLATRVYPVRDLVLMEFERTVDADFDSLIDTITSTIHPDSWDEVGGPGAVEPEYASMSLVISQTWSIHRELEQLLTTLRTARDKQGISPARAGSKRAISQHFIRAKPQPWPPRRHRSSVTSGWQVPRAYE